MLDPWDELETLQKGRRHSLACARDLESIRDSCIREHSKRHVVECPECWTRLIHRLRDRYVNSPLKEWFSGRRPFLQELDDLFAKARQHEVDFKTIEQRIADEKKEWLRDKVRNLSLHPATKSPAEARALQQKMNDREIPADQLVAELRDCLGVDTELYNEVFLTFSKHVRTAQPPTARAHAYIDALFLPERDAAGAAKMQKYIDVIMEGKPVAEVMNTMARDRQATKGDVEQKQRLQRKLEELRRAKAAHELSKNKKNQLRQERARAAMREAEAASTLPPCSACTQSLSGREFVACPLCQVLADHFKVLDKPTSFCASETCQSDGYESHMKAVHECSSGSDCLDLVDSDTRMDIDEPMVVICRECVTNLGHASAFCSSNCYDANFQRHRDSVHIPERKKKNLDNDDKGKLEFDPEDETRYSARKIEEHVISLRDALSDWQQTTGAAVS
ncbi:hypothetical protein F4808DRAFT_457310 [Astrocystis sublimbata]|nr:hypothetical protein F4808DRAFT_457310 [Astrocystis sublimbata]